MNTRKLSLAILTIAAIAPVVASATTPEDVALNACAKAFASSIAGGSSAPAYKLNYDQRQGINSIAGFYVRNYSFTMQAQDRKTGAALATATCSADTRGAVLELIPTATTAMTTLAAR